MYRDKDGLRLLFQGLRRYVYREEAVGQHNGDIRSVRFLLYGFSALSGERVQDRVPEHPTSGLQLAYK